MLFENYSRSEQSLLTTMAVIVLEGVSTRKIARITEELCGTSFSKSAVSEVCKSLDTYVNEFRNRPLTDSYPFLTVDATYFKVRENHRVTARALMIAFAVNSKGLREVVGFKAYPNEGSVKNLSHFSKIQMARQSVKVFVLQRTSDRRAMPCLLPKTPSKRKPRSFRSTRKSSITTSRTMSVKIWGRVHIVV